MPGKSRRPVTDVVFLGAYGDPETAWTAMERLAEKMQRTRTRLRRAGVRLPEQSLRIREAAGVWYVEMVVRARG